VSERTAVYRLFAVDDTLLYVGVGREFGVRWERHAKTQPWWPHVDHQTVQWYPGREDALAAEDQAIKSERPVYNIAGSPWIGGIKDDGTGFFVITKPVKLAPAKAAHLDALPALKDGDSARAASRGTSEASCFAGICHRKQWSYVASAGV